MSELRMKATLSSVSLALGLVSPNLCRLFSRISLLLSALSPLNKCSGFTHFLTSHLWQTTSSSLSSPQNILYDSLCADTCLPSFHIAPYPVDIVAPLKIQQPFPSMDTFDKILSFVGVTFLPIFIIIPSKQSRYGRR